MYMDKDLLITEECIEWDKERKKIFFTLCHKCGRACGLGKLNEMLVYNYSESGDLLVSHFCPEHADENMRLFGEAAKCPTCNEAIIYPPIVGVVKCKNCNRIKHPHNVIHVLKYDLFKQGIIETREFCHFCRHDAEAYASSFSPADRFCSRCNLDLVLRDNVNDFASECYYCKSTGCPKCQGEQSSFNSVFCDICMSWGCRKCRSKNADDINGSAPENVRKYVERYKGVCSSCIDKAKNKLNIENHRVNEALSSEIIVKSEDINRFEVIKDFGRIDIEIESNPDECFDARKYKLMLLENAIRAGGNAIYEYEREKNWKKRPYYDTVDVFRLSGRAVLHRKNNKRR